MMYVGPSQICSTEVCARDIDRAEQRAPKISIAKRAQRKITKTEACVEESAIIELIATQRHVCEIMMTKGENASSASMRWRGKRNFAEKAFSCHLVSNTLATRTDGNRDQQLQEL
jgi:hypothetical protein